MKLRLLALLLSGCAGLLVVQPAEAIPTCELHCNENTPCDQVCRVQGTSIYRTCASYVCDEPHFPWKPQPGLTLTGGSETADMKAAPAESGAEVSEQPSEEAPTELALEQRAES